MLFINVNDRTYTYLLTNNTISDNINNYDAYYRKLAALR